MHPDDRATVLATLEDRFTSGRSFAIDYRLRTRSGQILW
jgi:hypothetical protein